MNKVQFSVIIPVYNAENTIEKCVDSIKNQTLDDYEIILVDDGSKDNSWNLCEQFEKDDSRIRAFHTPNHGVSHARNVGLSKARGRFVAFVDSDDYVDDCFLHEVSDAFKLNQCQLVVVGVSEIKNGKLIKNSSYSSYNKVIDANKFLYGVFEPGMFCGYLCNKIFDLSIIKEQELVLDETISICEDTMFCYKYSRYIKQAYVIDKPFYKYIRNDNSATQKMDRNKILTEEKVADQFLESIDDYMEKKLVYYIKSFCCNQYFDCIYKADFKNGIYDKNHIRDIMRKIDNLDLKKKGIILKLKYILVKYMPRVAYSLYRLIRIIRRKPIMG